MPPQLRCQAIRGEHRRYARYTTRRSRAVPREMSSNPRSASEGRSVPSMTAFATELPAQIYRELFCQLPVRRLRVLAADSSHSLPQSRLVGQPPHLCRCTTFHANVPRKSTSTSILLHYFPDIAPRGSASASSMFLRYFFCPSFIVHRFGKWNPLSK